MTILNSRAGEMGINEVKEEDVRKAYPDMGPTVNLLTQHVTVKVHCECSLTQALVDTHLSSGKPANIAIGVSKLCCWLCREYIAIVQRQYPHVQIFTPSCYGKVTAGWTLPEGSPAGIRDAMYQRVQEMVDEVVARSTKRKRADSISYVLDSPSQGDAIFGREDLRSYWLNQVL